MAKLNDISGKTFGNWEVLYRNGSTKNKMAIWHCRCNICGKEKDLVGQSLTQGRSTKCRSCSATIWQKREFTHDPIVHVFSGMWQRCYDINQPHYSDYGGRGIAICSEWLNNREEFYRWAYSNGYKQGMTIERKNVNLPYSPENCCFIPLSEQSANRRNSILITIDDKTQCLSWWCRQYNISRNKVRWLVNGKKMSYKEAILFLVNK